MNEKILGRLMAVRDRWADQLPDAEAGPAIGPRSATWRRLSELVQTEGGEDPDMASELAEMLAAYIRALHPLLESGHFS